MIDAPTLRRLSKLAALPSRPALARRALPAVLALALASAATWAQANPPAAELELDQLDAPGAVISVESVERETRRQRTEELYAAALQAIDEGRKTDASKILTEVIQLEPLHAGAWLDLGMIQCALGHTDEAEFLFATVEQRFALSPAMSALIASERRAGCQRWRARSIAALRLTAGSDQNVNQGARTARHLIDAPGGQVEYELSDDFRPQSDNFVQLTGDYAREFTPNGVTGLIQYQLRRNDTLHRYDTATLYAGVEAPWRFGNWKLRATGTLGLVTLGHHLYQRQAQVQARVTLPLPLPSGWQLDTVGAITQNVLPTLSNFDSRTHDLRAHLTWRNASTFASASLGRQTDTALAERPGGSRDGHYLNLLARWRPLEGGASTELGYSQQRWHSSSAYAPGLIDITRSQLTKAVHLGVSYPLTRADTLLFEARLVRNHENISIFRYSNRQLQLSWHRQFP